MALASGALRLVDWMVPERDREAHAFTSGDRIPFRSLCDRARWTVKAIPATTGPLCPVCERLVRLAAEHLTDVMAALTATPIPELESRALWGDR